MTVSSPPVPGFTRGADARAWYAIVIFALAAVLSYTDRLILNLLVAPIRTEMAITDTQVSFLQGAAFAVIYAFAGLPMGRHADRHGRRNLILAGIGLWSLATALCGLAQSYGQLFGARILVGIGEAALAPAVLSMVPDLFPPHRRGTAVAIFIGGMVMGAGMATLVGGILIDVFSQGALSGLAQSAGVAPWRAVLLTLGVAGVFLALLVATIREPDRRESLGGDARPGLDTLRRYLIDNRWAFGLLLGGLTLTQIVDYGANSWTPSLLMRVHDFTPAETGTALGGILIGVAGLGTIVGGLLADFLEARGYSTAKPMVAGGAISLGVPCLLFAVMPDAGPTLALFTAYAFLLAIGGGVGIAAILDLVPSELRGMTTAVQAFAYTAFGLGLGPTLVAVTTDHVFADPTAVGLSISVTGIPLLALAALAMWRSLPHYRRVRQRLASTATS